MRETLAVKVTAIIFFLVLAPEAFAMWTLWKMGQVVKIPARRRREDRKIPRRKAA